MLSYFALYWVVLMLGILLLMFQKKKKLPVASKKKFFVYLQKIENISSTEQQIIEADKLYHQILKAYGYKWTFWEILKQKPKVISDIQAIWELHKLRNKLVHELGTMDTKMLVRKSKEYQKEINKILGK